MTFSQELTRESQRHLREASGSVNSPDLLVGFLYDLMRDHVQPGVVAQLVRDAQMTRGGAECEFTNGWLAEYAKYIAGQLKGEGSR